MKHCGIEKMIFVNTKRVCRVKYVDIQGHKVQNNGWISQKSQEEKELFYVCSYPKVSHTKIRVTKLW